MFPALLLALTLGLPNAKSPEMEAPASAEICGRCHRSIQETWKMSSHAQAMESRLFQDVLELAEDDFGPSARRTCLECHAPIAVRTGDLALSKKVSWEGVTCDYCHSIRDIAMGGPNPKAHITFAAVKSGPLKDAVSSAHGTQYSDVHTGALICASCHDYKNAAGFPVLTTYTEWKSSSFGKGGIPCQSCHMSRVAGSVVDPRIKRTSEAKINLHQMPGSHSLEQLTAAVKAQLTAVREGDALKVTVDVANAAAGHSLPPARRCANWCSRCAPTRTAENSSARSACTRGAWRTSTELRLSGRMPLS